MSEYLKAMFLRDKGADEMDFVPFYSKYKNIAERETRTIKIPGNDLGVPRGEYIINPLHAFKQRHLAPANGNLVTKSLRNNCQKLSDSLQCT